MMQSLPKVMPINELKNTAQITQTCKESKVPIVITKNGYGEMVLMSVELYEQTIAKIQASIMINNSLDELEGGAKSLNGKEFFGNMRTKYGV